MDTGLPSIAATKQELANDSMIPCCISYILSHHSKRATSPMPSLYRYSRMYVLIYQFLLAVFFQKRL